MSPFGQIDNLEASNGGVVEVVLDSQLTEKLRESALQLPKGVYSNSLQARGDFLRACDSLGAHMRGTELGHALDELKNGNLGVVIIKGVPRDSRLSPAPIDGGSPLGKETFVSEGVACAIAEYVGAARLLLF